MAVAIVQQQQQANDKINIDLSNSKVAVVKSKEESNQPEKKELNNKEDIKTENKVQSKDEENQNKSKAPQKEQTKSEEKQNKNQGKSNAEIKEEVKKQKPVMEEIQLPVPKQSRYASFAVSPYDLNDFASDVNKRLYEYEKVKSNQSDAMNEAIRLHNGDPSNTCVFFQSACLRAIGIPVPNNIGYTSVLWNWLEDNNWEMHRDFSNIQKGDIIFASEYHTMCFMGWKDKANGIAYVMGNQAYTQGDSYSNRNLNGQTPSKENGWNNQYRATRYYKYKGTPVKGNGNSDITDTSTTPSNPSISQDHKYTVEAFKGTVTAKQDVYINEKPFPTTEGIKAIGLAHGGDTFTVTGKASNGWYEVLYNGQKAYISNKYTNYIEAKEDSSNKPVKPTTPTTPNKPDDSKKPVNPSEPSKSTDESKDTEKPVTPEKPNKPVEPTKPTDSTDENKTQDSNKPVKPTKPVEPTKPEKPVEPSKPAEATVKTAFIKANGGLWLHSNKDSYTSSRLALMSNGTKVEVLDESGSWFKVKYNGNTGWCSKDYLTDITSTKVPSAEPSEPTKPVAPNKPDNTVVKTASIKANGGLWLHSTKDSYISSRINIMDKGAKVTILEESGSWFKVNYNGKTGWCSSEFLTEPVPVVKPTEPTKPVEPAKPVKPVEPSKPAEVTVKTAHIKANGGLWLHSSKDSYASSRITIMSNGEKVEILDESGSWFKVNYNGNMGWCSSQFLTNPTVTSKGSTTDHAEESKPIQPTTPVEPSKPIETTVKTAYIKANGGLWLHSSKDSYASSRITIMNKGSKVRILDESGSWFKVNYNGNIGWCSSEFLTNPSSSQVSTSSTKPSTKTVHIQANGGLWLHSSKDTSASSRLTNMYNGAKVTVLEKGDTWSKVDYNGNIGWCYNKYII
ncbi:SH3 domain-containing protein [Clostridium sp. LIBA-8841]|uniref:SH3 domain-containing protein n=1 Tax=Clostridium sp. LIBA-8841 TaxID=2987530 RepID=UPI002AC6A64B|nr:SH3 domain-containing protein [Clostridium sp. LIBA-8841]MDZ5252122.1 SH3 domain-containing protein [Clostridium sp. LIBA-8841]